MELTEAEQRLTDAAKNGEVADYRGAAPADNDPAKGPTWGESRTIRADTIYQLVTQSNPAWSVRAKGVQITGARIRGRLDFTSAEIECPLVLIGCYLDEDIALTDASARSITLTETHVFRILADRLNVGGSMFLDQGFNAKGEVALVGAKIDGQLKCRGGNFEKGLNAEGMKVGDVFFDQGFNAKGDVCLLDAKLDGQLVCTRGSFENGLKADFLKVGSVFLDQGFNAEGDVRLLGAKIDGQLVCTRGTFETGLKADGLKVGSVGFNEGFHAKGDVSLVGAKVDGLLVCTGGSFEAGLNADGLKVVGGLFLDEGFHAKGDVSLVGAEIDGRLVCTRGTFGNGLIAVSLKVGSVVLNQGFNAEGMVRVGGAEIDGALICSGGTFGAELNAGSLKVVDVLLDEGFNAKGVVNLRASKIDGHLICGGTFQKGLAADILTVGTVVFDRGFNAKGDVSLVGAEIATELDCSGGTFEGNLDLRKAHAGSLADDPKSWPALGKLFLDGFDYTISSSGGVPRDAKRRLNWIERGPDGPKDPFLPQPYEQLVNVLHAMGDEDGARKVSIRERWMLRKRGRLGPAAWLWNWVLYLTVGYGYRAWLPLVWAAAVVVAGGFIFQPAAVMRAADAKVPLVASVALPQKPPPAQSAKSELPHPFLYSIDVFLPFADINQKETWQVDESGRFFIAYQVWYLFEELAGWVLTGLLAAAATGLLKK